MKKILFLAIIAVARLAVLAQDAPTYYSQSIVIPNVSEGGVSNALAQTIDCRKQQNIALELTTSSAITNQVYRFSASVSGLSWVTNRYVIGTGSGTTVTNLAVAGVGYLRLDSVSNPGIGTSTNTAYYGIKISSP